MRKLNFEDLESLEEPPKPKPKLRYVCKDPREAIFFDEEGQPCESLPLYGETGDYVIGSAGNQRSNSRGIIGHGYER